MVEPHLDCLVRFSWVTHSHLHTASLCFTEAPTQYSREGWLSTTRIRIRKKIWRLWWKNIIIRHNEDRKKKYCFQTSNFKPSYKKERNISLQNKIKIIALETLYYVHRSSENSKVKEKNLASPWSLPNLCPKERLHPLIYWTARQ